MPAPIIGTDCHVTFTHPNINSGEPYGFIIAFDPSVKGDTISVQRYVDEDGIISIRLFAAIILADDLKNPDGSTHAAGRDAMYATLLAYLSSLDGVAIETPIGVFSGLSAYGHSATEMHQPNVSYVSLQLNNIGQYVPPISSSVFFSSLWDGEGIQWDNNMIWR